MRKIKPLAAAIMVVSSGVAPAWAASDDSGPLEEIVVTGSYIQRSSFDSSSPLDVVSQEDFAKMGAISVRDLAQAMPYNLGSENFPDTLRSGSTTGTENINLRGLGINSTLVLMNGRRHAESPNLNNDGVAFVDTASMMPTIAIERMEVLKDGAAALYGSDAISGVVNFITRNDFEGLELSFDNQSITNYEDDMPRDIVVQGIAGFGGDRGHAVMAASLLDRSPMAMYERDYTFAGGLSGFGSPGTIFPIRGAGESDAAFAARQAAFQASSFTGAGPRSADLDCENVPHAQGNPGDNGRRPVSFLSGDTCLVDFLPTQSIIDEERRIQLWAAFDYMLNVEHNIEIYGEFQAATNEVKRGNSPTYGFVSAPTVPIANPGLRNDAFRRGFGGEELINDAAAQALGFADAVAAAAANPLVGPVITNVRPFVGVPEEVYRDNSRVDNTGYIERDKTHFVGGLRGDFAPLGDSWTFDLAVTYSEHQFSGFTASDTNNRNMLASLDGFGGRDCNPASTAAGDNTGGCYFYNPFGSAYLAAENDLGPNGLYNATEMWGFMFDPILSMTEQEVFVIDGVITGDLFELPTGTVGVALGAQYRDQRFDAFASGTGKNFNFSFVVGQEPFGVERDVYAIFGEALVPLSDQNSALGPMELSLAVRYEDYGDATGSTTDPKVAILWQPIDDLSVRGSFQTSFKAPGLAQLGGSSTSLNNVQSDPFDPNSARIFVPGIAVGNANLEPETADVFNIGGSWQPSEGFLAGLEVNLDYWSFAFDNAIRKESNVSVIADFAAGVPSAQSKVTLDGLGNIAVIRSEFINAASVDTAGIDLSLSYPFDFGNFGQVSVSWTSTHLMEYEFQESPTGPKIDGKGKRNFQTIGAPAPEWRGNLGIDWLKGNHSATVWLRHTTDYEMSRNPSALIAGLNGRTPSADIDAFTTVDVQYSYQFQELLGLNGPMVTLGAINLFNEDPPTLDDGPGYDSKIHDPRGQVVYGRLLLQF